MQRLSGHMTSINFLPLGMHLPQSTLACLRVHGVSTCLSTAEWQQGEGCVVSNGLTKAVVLLQQAAVIAYNLYLRRRAATHHQW